VDGPTPTRQGAEQHAPVRAVSVHLLTRLNQRGFRLVQLADAVALAVVLVGAMVVRYGWEWPTYPRPLYAVSFVITLAIFMASLYFGGLYEREPRLGRPSVLPRAGRQTLAAGGLVALLNLAATGVAERLGHATERALPMPTVILVVLILLGAAVVAMNRRLSTWMRTNREGPSRVLLVGAPDDLNVALAHVDTDADRARVVGTASDVAGLVDRVEREGVTDVVLLSSAWLDSMYPDVLQELDRRRVSVLQRVTAKETMFGIERVRQVGGMPFVLLRAHTLPMSRTRFKRFTDLLFLVALSPMFLPLLLVVTLYQLVVVGRPSLFWQDRVGVGGETFRMVKFRTMYEDAEEDGNPRLATQEDPRIIPACRWLRATRLDELPQVYNVLRGEMSLVGPRPERPELTAQFEELIPGYSRRHEVPPGLTGLAQIHGRYHTDPEYKLGYDLQYLVNWSPVLDLEILARTVWVVVTRRI
jgi:exopolysaccharide biosynthesis polyprenyl glycosylphosphotransferase